MKCIRPWAATEVDVKKEYRRTTEFIEMRLSDVKVNTTDSRSDGFTIATTLLDVEEHHDMHDAGFVGRDDFTTFWSNHDRVSERGQCVPTSELILVFAPRVGESEKFRHKIDGKEAGGRTPPF